MLIRYGADEKGRPIEKAKIYTKNEHKIPLSQIDEDAIKVISRLRENGFSAYIVGGAVRDLIVGKKPKDFDIVTDATPSRIKKIFRNSRIIGRRFRLVHVFFGQKIFEVSTFRSTCDGSVGNAFGSMDEDVMRRDFSLNSLYYDPFKEQVIDYTNGFNDIKKGILKPVIPMETIFVEDPVRMLRAVKYSVTTKCKMNRKLKKKITQSASLLSPISPSRLTEELMKIINSGYSKEIVSVALDTDLYAYLQPAATELILESKKFEKKYMESLGELDLLVKNNPEARLGEKLIYIIRDFIETLTDWQKEVEHHTATSELYTKTWTQVRNFVLPMNPQRTELEYAIRLVLKSFGVQVKMPRKRMVLPPEK